MSTSEDMKRVAQETANRLAGLGIWLNGHESADDLTTMHDGVERFEIAVTSRGGDLMVDEPVPGQTPQPDDRHFALPQRSPDEAVAEYVERLARATDTVERHRRIGGA